MSISLVIPTIGVPSQKMIKESLESALKSSPKLWTQIIIVDNSKQDDFHHFLTEMTRGDSRVEIHKINDSMDMAQCWNKGLEYVTNPWVLYLHDDDVLLPDGLTNEDLKSDAAFINFGFKVFGSQNWKYIPQIKGVKGILTNTPKLVSTLINSDSLKDIGGWDSEAGYFLDLLAFVKLDYHYHSVINSKILGKYRLHNQNASLVHARNEKYSSHLPYFLAETFKLYIEEDIRRMILFASISFTYPNNSILKKLLSKTSNFFGRKAWLD